jgi:hypothetical protein
MRWVFVIPVIANSYVASNDATVREAAIISFQTIHQFGGVLLGEHLGQLFTIIWTVMISMAFIKLKFFPSWLGWLGIISSVIYLLAQGEIFATIIPGFPVWDLAGLIGSSLWLIWLIVTGIMFIKIKETPSSVVRLPQ